MYILKKNFILFLISFIFLLSCQTTEVLDEVVFDNMLLNKAIINAESKEIVTSDNVIFSEPFIEHVMKTPPADRINSWLESNISVFGSMNKLVIDIKKADITRKEIIGEIEVAGVKKKHNEYLYELNFIVHFVLYNETEETIANVSAEVVRSTTSIKNISINERNTILDTLTLDSLRDLSNKSVEMIQLHMGEYLL